MITTKTKPFHIRFHIIQSHYYYQQDMKFLECLLKFHKINKVKQHEANEASRQAMEANKNEGKK